MLALLRDLDDELALDRQCHETARYAVVALNTPPADEVEIQINAARQTAVAGGMIAVERDAYVGWYADRAPRWVSVPLPSEN
jgi:hypothetical protein